MGRPPEGGENSNCTWNKGSGWVVRASATRPSSHATRALLLGRLTSQLVERHGLTHEAVRREGTKKGASPRQTCAGERLWREGLGGQVAVEKARRGHAELRVQEGGASPTLFHSRFRPLSPAARPNPFNPALRRPERQSVRRTNRDLCDARTLRCWLRPCIRSFRSRDGDPRQCGPVVL